MRVLFDSQIFEYQKFGGISRYFVELLRELQRLLVVVQLPTRYVVTSALSDVDGLAQNVVFVKDTRRFARVRRVPVLRNVLSRIVESRRRCNRGLDEADLLRNDFDVFHPTHYDPYFIPVLKKPLVVTVFDMIVETFPEHFAAPDREATRKRLVVQNADRIITISLAVKRQLIEVLKVPDNKIVAIPLASTFKVGEALTPLPTVRPYFLFVGNRKKYKNFMFFLTVFAKVALRRPLDLIVTGPEFSNQEVAYVKYLGLENKVKYRFVSSSDLAGLYKGARAFIFPSMAEGFGIPILEAMSCGCPAGLSDIEVFHEVGGEAAIYFDPKSFSSMTTALQRLADDDQLCSRLAREGSERARLFSWERTAAETLRVYESVL